MCSSTDTRATVRPREAKPFTLVRPTTSRARSSNDLKRTQPLPMSSFLPLFLNKKGGVSSGILQHCIAAEPVIRLQRFQSRTPRPPLQLSPPARDPTPTLQRLGCDAAA